LVVRPGGEWGFLFPDRSGPGKAVGLDWCRAFATRAGSGFRVLAASLSAYRVEGRRNRGGGRVGVCAGRGASLVSGHTLRSFDPGPAERATRAASGAVNRHPPRTLVGVVLRAPGSRGDQPVGTGPDPPHRRLRALLTGVHTAGDRRTGAVACQG